MSQDETGEIPRENLFDISEINWSWIIEITSVFLPLEGVPEGSTGQVPERINSTTREHQYMITTGFDISDPFSGEIVVIDQLWSFLLF